MTPAAQHPRETTERTPLDPALLRIVQAMARADAIRDYDAAMAASPGRDGQSGGQGGGLHPASS